MSDHVSHRASMFGDQGGTAAVPAASSGTAPTTAARVIIQPRLLGLGLYRAWAFAYFSSLVLFPYTGEGLRMLYLSHSIQLGLGTATLALAALLAVRVRPLLEHRLAAGFVAVLAASGTLLPALAATISKTHATEITLLGIVLAGLATTWFEIMWGSYYVRTTRDVRDTAIHTGISSALGILLYFFALSLPRPIGAVVIAAFPLLSLIALPHWTGESWIGPVSRGVRQTRSISPFLIGVAVFGCVSYLLRILTSTGGPAVWDSTNRVAFLATGLASLAFAAAFASAKKPSSTMFRLVILLILAGYVMLPFLGPDLRVLSDAVFRIGYTCFEMMTWVLLINWARAARGLTIQIVALGSMAWRGGLWAGLAIGMSSTSVVNESTQLLTVSLLAVFALVIGVALVLSEKTLSSLGIHTEAPLEQPGKKAQWTSCCAEISARHGLTSREEEIMILLSRGRGTPAIEAGLGISRGTVRTHIKHIYSKLDVHSRQELVELIEGSVDLKRT